jgi:hypothetical protein
MEVQRILGHLDLSETLAFKDLVTFTPNSLWDTTRKGRFFLLENCEVRYRNLKGPQTVCLARSVCVHAV